MKKLILICSIYMLVGMSCFMSCIFRCGPFPDKLKLKSIDWYVCKIENVDSTMYYNDPVTSVILNDSVYFDQYTIYLFMNHETYFSFFDNINSYSLINAAYACSPIDPTTDERIDSVLIFSNKDFDTKHKAGVDLSEMFDVIYTDAVKNEYGKKFALTEFLATNPTVPDKMALLLKCRPTIETDHQFTVKYYQDGENKYFEYTTDTIVVLNH